MDVISSRQNPLVRTFRAVAQRRAPGRILLEGSRLIAEALESGAAVTNAAVTSARLRDAADIARLAKELEASGARIVSVPQAVMDALSPTPSPSGIVAIAECEPATLEAVFSAAPQLVPVLVGLQDPGNVGAVIRAADAAGATGVVTCERTADPWGWKALRGAMGSTFRVPVASPQTLAAALAAARAHRLHVIAAAPRDGRPLYETDLRGPTAILVGSEGGGLPPAHERLVDERVSIPMRAPVESLNVAVSAALVLYEAYRQRRQRHVGAPPTRAASRSRR